MIMNHNLDFTILVNMTTNGYVVSRTMLGNSSTWVAKTQEELLQILSDITPEPDEFDKMSSAHRAKMLRQQQDVAQEVEAEGYPSVSYQ